MQQKSWLKFNFSILFTLLTIIICSSCMAPNEYLPFRYRGDGEFVDNGAFSFDYRYVWDFGDIDEYKDGEKVFEIGGLPRLRLNIGFKAPVGTDVIKGSVMPDKSVLHVTLLDKKTSETLINLKGPLSEWVWGRGTKESFIYNTSPIDGNDKDNPDMKWNTSFTPKRGHTYQLTVKIVERDPDGVPLRIEMHGGGIQ